MPYNDNGIRIECNSKLKDLIRDGYGSNPVIHKDDLLWFVGLRDAGVDGAGDIVEALMEHEIIRLKESA
jgi:hypothetical protein